MADKALAQATASGLNELIARLREEGVAAGRDEAERLLADAQARAHKLVQKAEAEARLMVEAAHQEAEGLKRAGQEALRVAARDTVLDLKDRLARHFAEQIGKAVADAMADGALLRQMILEVAGRARREGEVDQAQAVELVLPRAAVGLDELRRRPEALTEGSLAHLAAAEAGRMLREGVVLLPADDGAQGIRLQLVERGVSIDLTDRAVAAVLLAHLQPRFRALLEGVIA